MKTQAKKSRNLGLKKIELHATKEGKLYINTVDLFSMEKVKAILSRVAGAHLIVETPKIEK